MKKIQKQDFKKIIGGTVENNCYHLYDSTGKNYQGTHCTWSDGKTICDTVSNKGYYSQVCYPAN